MKISYTKTAHIHKVSEAILDALLRNIAVDYQDLGEVLISRENIISYIDENASLSERNALDNEHDKELFNFVKEAYDNIEGEFDQVIFHKGAVQPPILVNKYIRITWHQDAGVSEASKDYLDVAQLTALLGENTDIIEESNGIYFGNDPDSGTTFVIVEL